LGAEISAVFLARDIGSRTPLKPKEGLSGPPSGLAHIDAVLEHGELANYYLAHSARADM